MYVYKSQETAILQSYKESGKARKFHLRIHRNNVLLIIIINEVIIDKLGTILIVFFCTIQNSILSFLCVFFQQIMTLGDQNLDGHMSFEEFVKYVTDHQKKLWIVFKTIDQDDSGKINFMSL